MADPGASHDFSGVPRHVAIIMDGNGRWAKARGLPRAAGHERGVEALRRTVEAAGDLGIECLTVFSFSTENWRRPAEEVSALFGLLKLYMLRDLDRLKRDGVRIRILGDRANLPEDILALTDKAVRETAHNTKFALNIAFNYGSRDELVRAVKRIGEGIESGRIAAGKIDEALISQHLDTQGLPDPDLVIRTSEEYRTSNFLLWQSAYAEYIFMPVFWPDFGREHLAAALQTFRQRERRFGGVTPVVPHG